MDPMAREKARKAATIAAKYRANRRANQCIKPNFVKKVPASKWEFYLPKGFSNEFLPKDNSVSFALEAEEGESYTVNYNAQRHIFMSGWREFVEDHGLAVGDFLLFELSEPRKFKVHIFRVVLDDQVQAVPDEVPARDVNIRHRALQDLQDALDKRDREIAERDATLGDALQKLSSLEIEKEAWQSEKTRLQAELCKVKSQKKGLLDLVVAFSARAREFSDEDEDLQQGFEALNIQ